MLLLTLLISWTIYNPLHYREYSQFRSCWVPESSMYTIGPGVGELRLGGVKALSPPPPGNADLDWGVSGLGRIALLCCGQGDGVCLLFPVGNSSFLLNLKVFPSCFTTQVRKQYNFVTHGCLQSRSHTPLILP